MKFYAGAQIPTDASDVMVSKVKALLADAVQLQEGDYTLTYDGPRMFSPLDADPPFYGIVVYAEHVAAVVEAVSE